jgi:hypothetical protein
MTSENIASNEIAESAAYENVRGEMLALQDAANADRRGKCIHAYPDPDIRIFGCDYHSNRN